MFLVAGFLTLLIQGFYSVKPFKKLEKAVFIGIFSTAISYLMLGFTTQLVYLVMALVCLSFGVGTMFTHLPSLLTKKIKPEITGQVMGLYDSVGSISRFLGPLFIYSFFFDNLSYAYLFSASVLLFVLIIFMILCQNKFFEVTN